METWCYNLALLFFIFLVTKVVLRHKQNLPPRPFAFPVIGHLHLLAQPLYQSLQLLLSRYGPILFLKLGSKPALIVSSPSLAEECFTQNDVAFANRPKSVAGDHFTYDYTAFLWAPYGDLWRNLRRFTVKEILSTKGLQKHSSIRREEVRYLVRRLFKASMGGTCEVDFKFMCSLLTVNIIMRVVAGNRYVDEEIAASEVENQLIQNFRSTFFPAVTMTICDFIPILRLIGYGGIEKKLANLGKLRDEFLRNLIDDVQRNRTLCPETESSSDEEKYSSIIDALLSLQKSEPEFYTDQVVKSTILVAFVAGTDTSASALEWAMALLLKHPESYKKLQAEIDAQVGHERLLNESDLDKLPYLKCVINETLRLYPPAPLLLPHMSSETCKVGGYEIPGGTTLIVNAWAMHRDPRIWDNPNEFMPERFETVPAEREGFKFVPFGVGRRACPGASMATLMISLALGTLIQCFEWAKVGPDVDMSPASAVTLHKEKPLKVLCSLRQNLVKHLSLD
ncbi:hypothetical protein K2173_007989 [Erythroxylum novogranatense]|uniref:Cytochrome P450 n=1 Tax=Erythroxylum novogranatense TaxID=1862640 RepID=A0AAV8T710_9ROSI|nr:hypothetical protein K2173_007989 [Erythroxylum novogranatense]